MANALTISALAENIFTARDQVARELVGFIPSVILNAGSERVSVNGTVTSFRTAQPTLGTTITPAMTMPDGDDQTIGADTMTIGQTAVIKIPITGNVFEQLANTVGYAAAREALIAQGIRTMVNAIEAHVGLVAKNGSSRAWGTAGTAPFGTPKLADAANMQKILDDNGCPIDGRSLIINSSAAVALATLTQLTNVSEAGTADLLRRGILGELFGFSLRKSAQVANHTKGTLAGSPTITNANFAVGATSLTLSAAGTGTIVSGDALSIANDTANVYIVNTGDADVSGGGTVILNAPGLRQATGASTRALTVAANYAANMAFHRSAIELVVRPPAMPLEGDAGDHMIIADDKSPLVFDAAIYPGYFMNVLHLSCHYQAKVWKPDYVATLLG